LKRVTQEEKIGSKKNNKAKYVTFFFNKGCQPDNYQTLFSPDNKEEGPKDYNGRFAGKTHLTPCNATGK